MAVGVEAEQIAESLDGDDGAKEGILFRDRILQEDFQGLPSAALREKAMEEGMTTLLQNGIIKSLRGNTDFRQVRRVCIK